MEKIDPEKPSLEKTTADKSGEKPSIDIEKIKKRLKKTGEIVSAAGWLTIIANIGLYLWNVFDNQSFAQFGLPAGDLSGTFLMVVASSICIILGNRIKKVVDKRMLLYLYILLGLSLLILIWVLATGGRIGFLFFLVIAYLASSLVSLRKAMKVDAFATTLTTPTYKLKKSGWIISGVIVVVIFCIAVGIDVSRAGYSTRKTALENVANYFANNSSWKEFNSPVGQFKVELPTYPGHKTESTLIPNTNVTMKYDLYSSVEGNGTSYLVSVFTYDSHLDTSNPDTNLEGALNGMLASGQGNTLISSSMGDFSGHRAIEFLIQNTSSVQGKVVQMKGKSILVGQTLYQLMVAYEKQNYDESKYNRFMNSFVLK